MWLYRIKVSGFAYVYKLLYVSIYILLLLFIVHKHNKKIIFGTGERFFFFLNKSVTIHVLAPVCNAHLLR